MILPEGPEAEGAEGSGVMMERKIVVPRDGADFAVVALSRGSSRTPAHALLLSQGARHSARPDRPRPAATSCRRGRVSGLPPHIVRGVYATRCLIPCVKEPSRPTPSN